MNTFNQYNNANVILNNEFIFDPWLYGSIYNNSWYPYGDKTLKKSRLKKIKYCFISHIHKDHWGKRKIVNQNNTYIHHDILQQFIVVHVVIL